MGTAMWVYQDYFKNRFILLVSVRRKGWMGKTMINGWKVMRTQILGLKNLKLSYNFFCSYNHSFFILYLLKSKSNNMYLCKNLKWIAPNYKYPPATFGLCVKLYFTFSIAKFSRLLLTYNI